MTGTYLIKLATRNFWIAWDKQDSMGEILPNLTAHIGHLIAIAPRLTMIQNSHQILPTTGCKANRKFSVTNTKIKISINHDGRQTDYPSNAISPNC